MKLISPTGTRFCCFAAFYWLPVYRIMLPKMPNLSKYKPSCTVADRDYE
jgi:hypothetical protein